MAYGKSGQLSRRPRWPWVVASIAAAGIGGYTSLVGLVAPWTDAPEVVTLALFFGGCALAIIGLIGTATALGGDGGRPWVGRWLVGVLTVAVVVILGYVAD